MGHVRGAKTGYTLRGVIAIFCLGLPLFASSPAGGSATVRAAGPQRARLAASNTITAAVSAGYYHTCGLTSAGATIRIAYSIAAGAAGGDCSETLISGAIT